MTRDAFWYSQIHLGQDSFARPNIGLVGAGQWHDNAKNDDLDGISTGTGFLDSVSGTRKDAVHDLIIAEAVHECFGNGERFDKTVVLHSHSNPLPPKSAVTEWNHDSLPQEYASHICHMYGKIVGSRNATRTCQTILTPKSGFPQNYRSAEGASP